MGGVLGLFRDLLIIYVCVGILGVWLFNSEFSMRLGISVIILLLTAIIFMLQRVGIIPSKK
ncbi:MAG: hypothetical protein QXG00_03935 [Candidatus Woesearchaeota archaeon]